jgi:polysaccharide export outer membrane protein
MTCLIWFMAATVAASAAQLPPPPPKQPVSPPEGAYVLGPQDLLKITVFDEPDLTNSYRVDSDGSLNFPLIGLVPAGGLTVRGLEERLTSALAAGYLRNPQVRVEIEQYRSRSVFVIGEVRSPGRIAMSGRLTVIEALAMAGSPTAAASTELIVVHPKKANPARATLPEEAVDADRIRINIRDLQLGSAGLDIVLADGDTVYVPKAQTFYVTGQVRNPGAYVLDPPMSVLQAISLAGGITENGSSRGIRILRTVNGIQQEITASLTDLIQGDDTIQVRRRFF